MQIPRSSRTSRTVFIFFMRVLYQRLEGLSRGNLRKLENGTLFDQNLSVRPFCQKLLPAIKRGLLSAVEAVQNLLRGAKGDEDDEHGERGVFHGCIISRIGKNARRKKENSPENLTLMVPSRVSHRAIDPGTPIIFKSSQK